MDLEIEILQELLNEVLVSDEAIASACDVAAELDCLLSFAEASRLYTFRRPEMIDENYVEIIQGRSAQDFILFYFIFDDLSTGIRCTKQSWTLLCLTMPD